MLSMIINNQFSCLQDQLTFFFDHMEPISLSHAFFSRLRHYRYVCTQEQEHQSASCTGNNWVDLVDWREHLCSYFPHITLPELQRLASIIKEYWAGLQLCQGTVARMVSELFYGPLILSGQTTYFSETVNHFLDYQCTQQACHLQQPWSC